MARILALQKLQYSEEEEAPANSGGSATCVGCSCASNGCKNTLAGL